MNGYIYLILDVNLNLEFGGEKITDTEIKKFSARESRSFKFAMKLRLETASARQKTTIRLINKQFSLA